MYDVFPRCVYLGCMCDAFVMCVMCVMCLHVCDVFTWCVMCVVCVMCLCDIFTWCFQQRFVRVYECFVSCA